MPKVQPPSEESPRVAGTSRTKGASNATGASTADHADSKDSRYYFLAGILSGVLLTILAIVPELLHNPLLEHKAILFCGLGLLIGAFGSTATVRYQGIVITGAAALAVVLSWTLGATADRVVSGVIGGTATADSVIMDGSRGIFVGRESRENDFSFFASEKDINKDHIRLAIGLPTTTYLFQCIARDNLFSNLGTDKKIEWQIDYEKGELLEKGQIIAQKNDRTCSAPRSTSNGISSRVFGYFKANAALADEVLQNGFGDDAFSLLSSGDVRKRLLAREKIADSLSYVMLLRQGAALRYFIPTDPKSSLIWDGVLGAWGDALALKIDARNIFDIPAAQHAVGATLNVFRSSDQGLRGSAESFLLSIVKLDQEHAKLVFEEIAFRINSLDAQSINAEMPVLEEILPMAKTILCTYLRLIPSPRILGLPAAVGGDSFSRLKDLLPDKSRETLFPIIDCIASRDCSRHA